MIAGNVQYKSREKTDKLFLNHSIKRQLSGVTDSNVRFIEKIQLTDVGLWKKFVLQFRDKTDGADRGWRGEYWGKMMRGACMTYQYTQNDELYKMLEESVKEMLELSDEHGRICTYHIDSELCGWDMWVRKYVVLGMLHFYEICKDNKLKDDIISVLDAHCDYIIREIGPEKGQIRITSATVRGKYSVHGVNSSSILEPMMRMYNITDDKKYLDFSRYIIEEGGADNCNIFELAYEGKLYPYQYPAIKAYEIMSCFEGLIEYYRVTGEEKYLVAAENFVRLLIESEITVIGCAGCMGEKFDNAAVTQTDPDNEDVMQETCVTVTWMKLCAQLLLLTGKTVYAHQIEKSYYNAMLGSVNTLECENNGGFPFDSYSPLIKNKRARGIGGTRCDADGNIIYGCCACIGSAGLALMPALLALSGRDGIYINFYEKGSIKGDDFEIDCKTIYPFGNVVEYIIKSTNTQKICIRNPLFSSTTKVYVNGNLEEFSEKDGYIVFDREWKIGDRIRLEFDFSPEVKRQNGYFSLSIGPLMLAKDRRLFDNVGEALKIGKNSPIIEFNQGTINSDMRIFKVSFDDASVEMTPYMDAGKTWDEASLTEVWIKESTV